MMNAVLKCGLCRRRFSTSILKHGREIFERDEKIHINVGLIGPSQTGKTSLASAFTKVLHESHGVPVKEISDIDNSTGERKSGQTQHPSHIELWRDGYRYSLTDLPGASAYSRNMLTHLSELDVAILVINPEEGVVKETIDMYNIAKHFGNLTIPVISTRSTDPEVLDLILMELEEVGLGQPQPIILDKPTSSGPDSSTTINNFFDALETSIIKPVRSVDERIYFPLEQAGLIPNRGLFCAGRVQRGRIKVGSQLQAFFNGHIGKGVVKDMEIFRKKTDCLEAGDRGGLFIKLKPDLECKRGAVLYEPGFPGLTGADWRVCLQSLPGYGPQQIKGEHLFYTSTFSSGQVRLDLEEVGGDPVETVLTCPTSFMALPDTKIVIKLQFGYLVGHLIGPCAES